MVLIVPELVILTAIAATILRDCGERNVSLLSRESSLAQCHDALQENQQVPKFES